MKHKILPLFFVSACGFGTQTIEELDPNAIPVLPEQIVYEEDIDPIFEFYCTACHGANENIVANEILLTEEIDVVAFCDLVIQEAFIERSMPPGGARRLTSSEEALLVRWMEFQNQIDPSLCSTVVDIP
jgi:uncharacterized membrane protein